MSFRLLYPLFNNLVYIKNYISLVWNNSNDKSQYDILLLCWTQTTIRWLIPSLGTIKIFSKSYHEWEKQRCLFVVCSSAKKSVKPNLDLFNEKVAAQFWQAFPIKTKQGLRLDDRHPLLTLKNSSGLVCSRLTFL